MSEAKQVEAATYEQVISWEFDLERLGRRLFSREEALQVVRSCKARIEAEVAKNKELHEQVEVGLQISGSFFDALKPLQLKNIFVENPGLHVTHLINDLNELKNSKPPATAEQAARDFITWLMQSKPLSTGWLDKATAKLLETFTLKHMPAQLPEVSALVDAATAYRRAGLACTFEDRERLDNALAPFLPTPQPDPQASKHDGDWNTVEQGPYCWRIRGKDCFLIDSNGSRNRTARTDERDAVEREIDRGFFVPNTWPIPGEAKQEAVKPNKKNYEDLGDHSSTPPERSIALWCDSCRVKWIGCQDQSSCPRCGATDAYERLVQHHYELQVAPPAEQVPEWIDKAWNAIAGKFYSKEEWCRAVYSHAPDTKAYDAAVERLSDAWVNHGHYPDTEEHTCSICSALAALRAAKEFR